jgi:hypothetical protein
MLQIIAAACLLTALSLAWSGCGDSKPGASGSTARETRQSVDREEAPPEEGLASADEQPKHPPSPKAAGFTGRYAEPFEIAAATCVRYTFKRMTEAFELPPTATPLEVAEGYGEGFEGPRFELAAQEGCLAALKAR